MSEPKIAICEHCDAVYQRRRLAPGDIANCTRCGGELYRYRRLDSEMMLALTFSALVVLIVANVYPIVTVSVQSTVREATLWGAVLATYDTGVRFVALLAALTVFLFPLLQLLLLLHVLLPLQFKHRARGLVPVMHALRALQPWAMVEVFMLGVLVSVVKLAGTADVAPQLGLWGFALLTLLMTLINSFDLPELWEAVTHPDCDP